MKKLILPLLLLVAFGMLAAVESAPSDVVGYVKYPCVAGLNLIAFPMEQGYAWASDFAADYPGSFDTMYWFNNANQTWEYAYDLGYWEGDFEIEPGFVMQVSALSAGNVYSIGNLPATNATYNFVAGLNTMMVPLNYSSFAWASDVATAVGTFDTMYWFNNTNQTWEYAYDLGYWEGDFPVSIGFPMQVSSMSATTWPIRGTVTPTLGTRSK